MNWGIWVLYYFIILHFYITYFYPRLTEVKLSKLLTFYVYAHAFAIHSVTTVTECMAKHAHKRIYVVLRNNSTQCPNINIALCITISAEIGFLKNVGVLTWFSYRNWFLWILEKGYTVLSLQSFVIIYHWKSPQQYLIWNSFMPDGMAILQLELNQQLFVCLANENFSGFGYL